MATERQLELKPDAWGRFERAVDAVSKSGPLHREAKDRVSPLPPGHRYDLVISECHVTHARARRRAGASDVALRLRRSCFNLKVGHFYLV
jgi:hypothetical protein